MLWRFTFGFSLLCHLWVFFLKWFYWLLWTSKDVNTNTTCRFCIGKYTSLASSRFGGNWIKQLITLLPWANFLWEILERFRSFSYLNVSDNPRNCQKRLLTFLRNLKLRHCTKSPFQSVPQFSAAYIKITFSLSSQSTYKSASLLPSIDNEVGLHCRAKLETWIAVLLHSVQLSFKHETG